MICRPSMNLYAVLYQPSAASPAIGFSRIASIRKKSELSRSLSISGNEMPAIHQIVSRLTRGLGHWARRTNSAVSTSAVTMLLISATAARPT
jgi:hypothetical protein